jgi:hypothetical protein
VPYEPGTCRDCGIKCGRSRCPAHRKEHATRESNRRTERRSKRLCTICGAKALKVGRAWLSTCAAHRSYVNKKRSEYWHAGRVSRQC